MWTLTCGYLHLRGVRAVWATVGNGNGFRLSSSWTLCIPEERVRPTWSGRRRRTGYATNLALLMAVVVLAGCATDPPGSRSNGSVITVVAAENFWGSLAEQLGGAHVRVTSIINSPDADPH